MRISLGFMAFAGVVLFLATAPRVIADTADRRAIPRLSPGPHMGMITGFDNLGTRKRAKRAAKYRKQAIKAGMTIGRAQIDWRDLETAPGVYDLDALTSVLEYAGRDGMAVFVTFSTIDTFELTLPDYLTGPDGMTRDGLKLDGPRITKRFHGFLDWFIPHLKARKVWGLALGNEVDAMIADHRLPSREVLNHLTRAVQHAKALDPALAVTVTLSGNADRNVAAFAANLVAVLDIVSFNTYCLHEHMIVNKRKDWKNVLKRWKKVAGKKQIFIQELGCPVGFGHSEGGKFSNRPNGIGGSPDLQARYFRFHMKAFANDRQLRAATVFQLYDWSPKLAISFGDLLRDAGDQLSGDRLEEWLATVGLCRWSDAKCRPAWKVWKEGLRTLEKARD